MPKERTDALKNKLKVVKSVVLNPLSTQREIAKDTWLSKTTVQEHLKELPNTTKDDRIIKITDADLKIVTLAQWIINDKLSDAEYVKTLKPTEVSSVAKDSTARYTILKGNVTDKDGWLIKDLSALSLAEIEEIRKELLK